MEYTLHTQFDLNEEVYVIHDNKIQQAVVNDMDIHIIIQTDKTYKRVKYHLHKTHTGTSLGFYDPSNIFKSKEDLVKKLYEESN